MDLSKRTIQLHSYGFSRYVVEHREPSIIVGTDLCDSLPPVTSVPACRSPGLPILFAALALSNHTARVASHASHLRTSAPDKPRKIGRSALRAHRGNCKDSSDDTLPRRLQERTQSSANV